MKVSDDDKMLIGAGILALGGLGFLFWKKKKNEQQDDELANYIPEPETAPSSGGSGSSPAQGATLDRNKLLKVGVKGLEVRELQRLLGVNIDGNFGAKETLPALQNAKGVSETSLNAFATTVKKKVKKTLAVSTPKVSLPKVGQKLMAAKDDTVIIKAKLPKVGDKLMAAANGIKLYRAKQTASKKYFNNGEIYNGSFKYGDALGVFVALNGNGNSQYLIKSDGIAFFVNAKDVKTY